MLSFVVFIYLFNIKNEQRENFFHFFHCASCFYNNSYIHYTHNIWMTIYLYMSFIQQYIYVYEYRLRCVAAATYVCVCQCARDRENALVFVHASMESLSLRYVRSIYSRIDVSASIALLMLMFMYVYMCIQKTYMPNTLAGMFLVRTAYLVCQLWPLIVGSHGYSNVRCIFYIVHNPSIYYMESIF